MRDLAVLFRGNNFLRLLGGLGVTLKLSALSVALSVALGLVVGALMTLKNPVLKAFFRLWLETVRIVPQLVLLFLVYFGLAKAFNLQISGETAAVAVFTFWGAGEMGDLVRGAITSIPVHQRESSAALGLTRGQCWRFVLLPQAARRLVPQAINLATRMIKTTSLVMLIGVVEVLPGHQPGHPHDQDHLAGDADRRGGGAEGGQPDHRCRPLRRAPGRGVGVRRGVYAVLHRLLAHIAGGGQAGKALGGVTGGNEMSEKPILEIRHLSKRFDANGVLKDVSLTLNEGEVIVIVGPSGCGKSTLLRCVNGLERPDGGEILLDGARVDAGADLVQVRRQIGMVFQSYDLFPHMDVMGNLTLGPVQALKRPRAQVEAEAQKMLERVGLGDKAHALPRQLSGGQKQRVALVRAMLMHPRLLLLDEITAALDPEMVREVLNVVLDLARDGMTMLIVTHEMRFAEAVADRVVFLEGGVVLEEAPPAQFFHHPETERARQFLDTFEFKAVK